jgi:hypothetical protein
LAQPPRSEWHFVEQHIPIFLHRHYLVNALAFTITGATSGWSSYVKFTCLMMTRAFIFILLIDAISRITAFFCSTPLLVKHVVVCIISSQILILPGQNWNSNFVQKILVYLEISVSLGQNWNSNFVRSNFKFDQIPILPPTYIWTLNIFSSSSILYRVFFDHYNHGEHYLSIYINIKTISFCSLFHRVFFYIMDNSYTNWYKLPFLSTYSRKFNVKKMTETQWVTQWVGLDFCAPTQRPMGRNFFFNPTQTHPYRGRFNYGWPMGWKKYNFRHLWHDNRKN